MLKRRAAIAAVFLLSACGGGGSSGSSPAPSPSPTPAPAPTPTPTATPTPTPTPVPTPTPTPTPTPAVSFFQGVTHFDAFDRADTAAGTVSNGPQGQTYGVYSNFLLAPDGVSRIRNRRFYTPPINSTTAAASYLLSQTSGRIERIGAVLEYTENTETTKGPYGYVWTVIVANQRNRFTDDMIHFTGSHGTWRLDIWTPGVSGGRRTIASGTINPPLAWGEMGVVDLQLDGNTIVVTVPGETRTITDAEIARYAGARYAVLEHFIPGMTQNVQQFRAWYWQAAGGAALNRAVFAPFEPDP